jgi:hypothetical protein
MSDETASAPEPSEVAESAPRVRRISTPRAKKVAKTSPAKEAVVVHLSEAVPASEKVSAVEPATSPAGDTDWPEPEAATTGGSVATSESAKRKRRRRKGKGQQAAQNGIGNGGPAASEEMAAATGQKPQETAQEARSRPVPLQQTSQAAPQQAPRPKIDADLLAKKAWKIYLAEVSEEGVALIGDNDAKDLSRRCFRLAEIFIEEQLRRR